MIAEFSDVSVAGIVGIFSSPQPVEFFPFQGEVFAGDPRYEVCGTLFQLGRLQEAYRIPSEALLML